MSQRQAAAAMSPMRRLNVPFLGALAIVIALYAVAFLILNALIPVEQMAPDRSRRRRAGARPSQDQRSSGS